MKIQFLLIEIEVEFHNKSNIHKKKQKSDDGLQKLITNDIIVTF